MSVEELLAMFQEKGMDDNAIRELLSAALDTISKDDMEHDEKEMAAEKEEAGNLLGVSL